MEIIVWFSWMICYYRDDWGWNCGLVSKLYYGKYNDIVVCVKGCLWYTNKDRFKYVFYTNS